MPVLMCTLSAGTIYNELPQDDEYESWTTKCEDTSYFSQAYAVFPELERAYATHGRGACDDRRTHMHSATSSSGIAKRSDDGATASSSSSELTTGDGSAEGGAEGGAAAPPGDAAASAKYSVFDAL